MEATHPVGSTVQSTLLYVICTFLLLDFRPLRNKRQLEAGQIESCHMHFVVTR